MGKYVIAKYLRLSVEDEKTESMSIPHQRLLLDRHIDSLDMYSAEVLEFVDNGFSGTNMERPAIQELLELLRSGGVNMICVKDFSRFSRSAMDSGYFIEQVFPLFGVRFISVDDGFDSDDYKNDTGGIDVAFKFLMHEYYSKDLSVKIKSAQNIKRKNGEAVSGSVPYGYRIGDNKKLVINPETADVVRFIFKMALDGSTTAIIRDALMKNAYPTPSEYNRMERGEAFKPNCRWDTQAIQRIVSTEQYTGTFVSGKYERITVGSHTMIETDPSKWVIIPDNHPAIISKEDFEQAQNSVMIKGSSAVKESNKDRVAERRVKKDGSAIGVYPLYGYTLYKKDKPQINPKPAEAIRQVFRMAIEGKTVPQICEALTQAGFPTPGEQNAMERGEKITLGKSWTRGAVNGILREIQYTGTAVSGRYMTVSKLDDGEPRPMMSRYRPPSEWRYTPNARPAIISEDVFNAVQEILANKPKKVASVRSYLLKYIGRCGCCGYSLRYDDGVGYPLYKCKHTYADQTADCYQMKFKASEIDDAVLSVIRKIAEVVLNKSELGELSPKAGSDKELSDYETRIAEINEQRQRHYESYILREINRDEFVKLKDECSAEIDRLNKQVAAFKAEAQSRVNMQSTRAIAEQALGETANYKEIVDTLIEKVYVFPDNRIEIVWKIADFAAQ